MKGLICIGKLDLKIKTQLLVISIRTMLFQIDFVLLTDHGTRIKIKNEN